MLDEVLYGMQALGLLCVLLAVAAVVIYGGARLGRWLADAEDRNDEDC